MGNSDYFQSQSVTLRKSFLITKLLKSLSRNGELKV